jgi:hypothetical protein
VPAQARFLSAFFMSAAVLVVYIIGVGTQPYTVNSGAFFPIFFRSSAELPATLRLALSYAAVDVTKSISGWNQRDLILAGKQRWLPVLLHLLTFPCSARRLHHCCDGLLCRHGFQHHANEAEVSSGSVLASRQRKGACLPV